MSTLLDQGQILQRLFDEQNNRLRVHAETEVVLPNDLALSINHADDNIAIGKDGNLLDINSDGSINVNVQNTLATNPVTFYYNEVSEVAANTLTEVNKFIAVGSCLLKRIVASGDNVATYQIEVNNLVLAKKRTFFGNSLDIELFFENGISLNANDEVSIKVVHNRPSNGSFNATVFIQ